MQQGVAPCVSSICTVGPSLSPTRCKAPVLPDGMRPPPAHGCGGAVCYWPTPQQEPWGQVSSHLWVSCSQQGLVAISPFTGSCPHPSQEISSLSSGTPFSHLQDLPKACPDPFQPTPVTPLPRESRAVSVTAGSPSILPLLPMPQAQVPSGNVPHAHYTVGFQGRGCPTGHSIPSTWQH